MNPSSLKLRRTGKIALVFTIVCAGQLYGMDPTSPYGLRRTGPLEPERGMGAFEELPQDVHGEIIRMAIESSNTLEKAIKAINVASALRGVKYDNLEDFTRLVHLLADKFNATTDSIARLFKTPTAEEYRRLGNDLMEQIRSASYSHWEAKVSTDRVAELIEQGVDVNFNTIWGRIYSKTPLRLAKEYSQNDFGYGAIMQMLIKAGAKE